MRLTQIADKLLSLTALAPPERVKFEQVAWLGGLVIIAHINPIK
jgi:hypothetical protein